MNIAPIPKKGEAQPIGCCLVLLTFRCILSCYLCTLFTLQYFELTPLFNIFTMIQVVSVLINIHIILGKGYDFYCHLKKICGFLHTVIALEKFYTSHIECCIL
jgi:hypothetical protein